ncbi:MAG: enoyl-CoA hydratase/isomerase family protein [Daejeonella sp.]
MKDLISYETINRIAYITLNRPEKKNALNPQLVEILGSAVSKAGSDDKIKVLVIRAAGDVFSAGADLGYLQVLQNNSAEDNFTDTVALKELFYSIYTLPKLVIAQVEGHAIAGGCGLACVCDIVFSVPEAKFGYTEVKIGFLPALVACFLVRKLGDGRARELLLSGELIDSVTASGYGLINFISDKTEIAARVTEYAEKLAASVSGHSVALTKQLLNSAQSQSLEDSLNEAVKLNVQARSSAECKRGIAAFLNKEKLDW